MLPLAIEAAEYLPDRTSVAAAAAAAGVRAEAGLRLRLRATAGADLADVRADRLPVFIWDTESSPGELYRQILGDTIAVVARAGDSGASPVILPPPEPYGFDDQCALLPAEGRSFRGYRILREYFACPERFLFFSIEGLRRALAAGGQTCELVFLFRRSAELLAGAVGPDNFRLFCSPAVNLFEKPLGGFHVRKHDHEHLVTPDRTRPLDFEIYRLLEVTAQPRTGPRREVAPLYAFGALLYDWNDALFHVTWLRPRRLSTKE